MITKLHKGIGGRNVLAVCDKEVLGEKFEEKNLQLDLSSNFYKGEEKTEKEILDLIKKEKITILNLAGDKSVKCFLVKKLISKEHIIKIKNIPHAQAVLDC